MPCLRVAYFFRKEIQATYKQTSVCENINNSNNIDVDLQQHFFPKMSSRQSGATRDLKKSIVEISQSLCFFDMTSTKQFLGQLLYYCLNNI